MDVVALVKYYEADTEAESAAEKYRKSAKVKTDVFRVKKDSRGWYVEQDIS